jgi:Ring finger domain
MPLPENSSANYFGLPLHQDAPKPHSADAGGKTTLPVAEVKASSPHDYDVEAGERMPQQEPGETIHDDDDDDDDDDVNSHDNKVLYLPPTRATTHHAAAVSNVCAICLEPYQVGDAVIWSTVTGKSSDSTPPELCCSHVFHKDCFVDYAVIKANGGGGGAKPIPCPTCRQGFMDLNKDQTVHPPSSVEDDDKV